MANHVLDPRAIRAGLFNDGYVVFRKAVSREHCEAVLEAIGTELGVFVDDPRSWTGSRRTSTSCRWGHQCQWDIRQEPALHAIWSHDLGDRAALDGAQLVSVHATVARGAGAGTAAALGRRPERPIEAVVPRHPRTERRRPRRGRLLLLARATPLSATHAAGPRTSPTAPRCIG